MADHEKKLMEVPRGSSPESQRVPANAETVESRPSAPEAPQRAPEKAAEQVPVTEMPRSTPAPVAQAAQKDELTQEIEKVLSEDLGDLYKQLPADRKKKFKEEGEKTAGLIRLMITKG